MMKISRAFSSFDLRKRRWLAKAAALTFACIMMAAVCVNAYGAPSISLRLGDNEAEVVSALQLFFMLSVIALAPFLILMMTCFTRIIISLHFLRSALGLQQMPPNQVLIGVALFLTLFVMGPILTRVNEDAITPYSEGRMSQKEAMNEAMEPIRDFMFMQVENIDMNLFIELSGEEYAAREDIPNRVLIPAFMLGELTKGFKIGFIIYLPFLAIDMIVSSALMAMGMMMLPPAMISLPFKLLLFVISNGWSIIVQGVLMTFR
ncbi:MAG: flagellar type III secretion system pore protein FliP [Clostridiales bacterium]|jgi:flagellar biosynthetic protein FliP|nr:flagellar type III secretion system pore protein FliP [Clostridiales bacterium]